MTDQTSGSCLSDYNMFSANFPLNFRSELDHDFTRTGPGSDSREEGEGCSREWTVGGVAELSLGCQLATHSGETGTGPPVQPTTHQK